MKFHALNFGEKCDTHPAMKPRSLDARGHVFANRVQSDRARVMQQTGEWAAPPDALRSRPPLPSNDLRTGNNPVQTSVARSVAPQPSGSSATPVRQVSPLDLPSPPTAPPSLKPCGSTPPAELRTPLEPQVGSVVCPAVAPPAMRSRKGASTEELDRAVDDIVRVIKQYVDRKSDFAQSPQVLSRVLLNLLKQHTSGDSVTAEQLAMGLSFLGLPFDRDTQDALFARLDPSDSGSLLLKDVCLALYGLRRVPTATADGRALIKMIKDRIRLRNPGESGIRSFTMAFCAMDRQHDQNVSVEELFNGLQRLRVPCTVAEVTRVVQLFDSDGNGKLNITEFVAGLAEPLPRRRKDLVERAFRSLDVDDSGNITMKELGEKYHADQHPSVLAGERTVAQVMHDFASLWDADEDGSITRDEFFRYYRGISSSIESDDYFELMMRNCWHMSGGEGVCKNTTCRRVLVTYEDDTQKIVELQNDIGVTDFKDHSALLRILDSQGERNVKKVDLYGSS